MRIPTLLMCRSLWASGVLLTAASARADGADPTEAGATEPAAAETAPEPTAEVQTHDVLLLEEPAGGYQPRRLSFGPVQLQTPVSLQARVDGASNFDVDVHDTRFESTPAVFGRVRFGARLSTETWLKPIRLVGEWEHDLVQGVVHGGASDAFRLNALGGPMEPGTDHQLRRAMGQIDITPYFHLMGGRMTSHWGLGLVANDGAHGWEPGSARFSMPTSGDRLLRAMVMAGPFTDHNLAIAAGYDVPRADDALRTDEAWQAFGSFMYGFQKPTNAGIYIVYRHQEAAGDGDTTEVIVTDVTGGHTFELSDTLGFRVEGEASLITGKTTFGSSVEYDEHKVRQFGGVLRVSLDAGKAGFVLDTLYVSGDDNANDDIQAGFKADPNFEYGLVAWRYVASAIAARQAVTAFDPELSGVPNEDLDRLTSDGQVVNTLAFFPRGWVRFCDTWEVYGGPLIALTPKFATDPLHTRLDGGDPRNAFDEAPGKFWGTEFDLGIRYRSFWNGTRVEAGAEGGAFVPGSALIGQDGKNLAPVFAGRLFVEYAL